MYMYVSNVQTYSVHVHVHQTNSLIYMYIHTYSPDGLGQTFTAKLKNLCY